MVPWQVALGVTIAAGGSVALLLPDIAPYLKNYLPGLLEAHAGDLAAPSATAAAALFATVHWLARKAGLGDLGRKVQHIDRGLRAGGTAHDRELAEALARDRAGDWTR